MSHSRFIRCPHCRMPHDARAEVCPTTGRPLGPATVRMEGGRASAPPPEPSAPRPPKSAPAVDKPTRAVNLELVGRRLGNGRYIVRRLLGEGGMGTVYEAEHVGLGRLVAIKVLNPTQAKKKVAVQRFQQEARAAGAIGHPNICEVYDLGTLDDGCPYLVMEKLTGRTLAERLHEEGALPFLDILDILAQVLLGLMAAHEKGIVHRDIKPENIFLARRSGLPDIAKLLDFGVSKMVIRGLGAEDMSLTRTGMVMGTPYYMSPEQARGDRNLDARVDVYACGVMLYEVLTGRRPFTAANYNALLISIIQTTPRPARELRPHLPVGFEMLLTRSMARSRSDRYPTAADFHRDVVTFREQLAALPPPPTREEKERARISRPANPPSAPADELPRLHPPSSSSFPAAAEDAVTRFNVARQPPRSRPAGEGLDFDDLPTQIHRPAPEPSRPRSHRKRAVPDVTDWDAAPTVARNDALELPLDPDSTVRRDRRPRR